MPGFESKTYYYNVGVKSPTAAWTTGFKSTDPDPRSAVETYARQLSNKLDKPIEVNLVGEDIVVKATPGGAMGVRAPGVQAPPPGVMKTQAWIMENCKFAKKEKKSKDWDPNPWAICHESVGPEKSDKFERCVQKVKKKQE